ncbi:MAG: serine/threonine protein kinase [Nannocystales bacterium]
MSEVQFGRYVLMEPLGKGGQGRVFLARRVSDLVEGWPVVIKLAHESAVHDERERARFVEEAKNALRLGDGPGIVTVTDVDVHDGVPFIVMNYDDGCDLRRVMRYYRETEKRPIPLPLACSLLRDMAEGLHFAHFGREVGGVPLGLVHRDVKPGNTLVSFKGHARLLDFGISTTRADERTGRTQYGTPRYMSQDHFYCKVNPSMDVYSLAVLAWEMLEGRTFRDGQEGFSGDFPWAVINLEPPPMRREGLPPDIVGLISAGLAPSARPSAQEFMTVVHRHVQKERRKQVKSMVQTVLGRRARTHHTRYMEIPEALREGEGGGEGPGDDEVTVAVPSQPEPEELTMMVSGEDEARQAGAEQDVPSFYRRKRNTPSVDVVEMRPTEESAPTVEVTTVLPTSESRGWSARSSSADTEVLPPPRATPVRVTSLAPAERAQTRQIATPKPDVLAEGKLSGRGRFAAFLILGMLLSCAGAVAASCWLLGGGK